MKFGKYLSEKKNEEWADGYLDYDAIKHLIKEAVRESEALGSGVSFSPRETSLSVQRATNNRDAAEERFFTLLESEVRKVGDYTSKLVAGMEADLDDLSERVKDRKGDEDTEALLAEAKRIGEQFLALEKFVNLNYLGFHKAVKKHDKQLPHAPCQQFYMHILRTQPWVQGDQSSLLIKLSAIYAQLRGQPAEAAVEQAREAVEASARRLQPSPSSVTEQQTSNRHWVRREDVSGVTQHVIQHLPVKPIQPDGMGGNTELINVVYLDNMTLELYHRLLDKHPNATTYRITWGGALLPETVTVERVKHRATHVLIDSFQLPESAVVGFLKGEVRAGEVAKVWRSQGQSEAMVRVTAQLFDDVQSVIESKQLAPVLRTQAARTTFVSPSDPTVVLGLDTNVLMMKENPLGVVMEDRWTRDITAGLSRTEVTRFPHAVLDVRLTFPATHTLPPWLKDLLNSGYTTEVDSFSKMLHGVAALLPDLTQAVPYWVDDASVRESLQASAPSPDRSDAGDLDSGAQLSQRRGVPQQKLSQMSHPLLGDRPTLQLMPSRADIAGLGKAPDEKKGFLNWWFMDRRSEAPPTGNGAFDDDDDLDEPLLTNGGQMHPRPKNVFALERTYLTWTHMAVTVGSVAAAMLGFSGTSPKVAPGQGGMSSALDITAIMLLPLAIVIAMYALAVYFVRWRQMSRGEAEEELYRIDKIGPRAMAGFVVGILAIIFIFGVVDFVQALTA